MISELLLKLQKSFVYSIESVLLNILYTNSQWVSHVRCVYLAMTIAEVADEVPVDRQCPADIDTWAVVYVNRMCFDVAQYS